MLTHYDKRIVYDTERILEYHKWQCEIPFIKFESEWEVKVIPPFGGAVVRFVIQYNNKRVSVYLDCYDSLGLVGEPYWEIYPYYGDTFRTGMNNVGELVAAIKESFESQEGE